MLLGTLIAANIVWDIYSIINNLNTVVDLNIDSPLTILRTFLLFCGIILTLFSMWTNIIGIHPFASKLKSIGEWGIYLLIVYLLFFILFSSFLVLFGISSVIVLPLLLIGMFAIYQIIQLPSVSSLEKQLKIILLISVLLPLLVLFLLVFVIYTIDFGGTILEYSIVNLFIPLIIPGSFLFFNIKLRSYLEYEVEDLEDQELLYMDPRATSTIPAK